MAIPAEDWLALAKRLPVGQSDRVQHRFESRQNLVIRNKPEGWSAYCHACAEGGFVPKEFVKIQAEEPREYRQMLPPDLVHLDAADAYAQQRVYAFLASKNMDMLHMQQAVCMYSSRAKRLVLGLTGDTGAAYLGRSIVHAQPKWTLYSTPVSGYPPFVKVGEGSRVVITEDTFSALKVQWACPDVQAVCSLGTKLSDALVLYLMTRGDPVVIFYDDDLAGRKGAAAAILRLRGLGLDSSAITADGCDPKDMQAARIREVINCE